VDGFAWTVIGSAAGVVAAVAAVIAIVRARADPGGEPGPDRAASARGRGQAVGSNTGLVIRARTVNAYGTAFPASPPQPAAAGPGLAGDTLPARNPVFTGRVSALAALAERLGAGPVAVVAVRGLGGWASRSWRWSTPTGNAPRGGTRWRGGCEPTPRSPLPRTWPRSARCSGSLARGRYASGPRGVVAALGARQDWLVVFDNAHGRVTLPGGCPAGPGTC
jgi:hypothetical protein